MAKSAKAKVPSLHEVAVVGGGAAGLAVALGLEKAGLKPLLVGVTSTPRDDGRTAALMAPSVRFLDEIGTLPRLEANSTPLAAMRLIDATGALVRAPTVTFRASEVDLPWFALNFANADMVRGMTAEALDRGLTCTPAQVLAAEFGAQEAQLALSDGATARARLVIAADGQKSLLRALSGLEVRSWTYDQTALTFHVTHSRDHEDISTEIHMRAGPLTFVPFGAFRCAVVWLVTPGEAERLRALTPKALAIAVQRASTSLLGDLEVVTPVAAVPMRGLIAQKATGTRLALAGEALHAFPPIGAQGLNLGLRDARQIVDVVGKALAAGRDPGAPEVLAAYESGRRIDAVSRTYGVDLLNRTLISGLLPLDLMRAAGLAAAANIGPFRRLLMRAGMGENLMSLPKAG